LRKLRYPRRQFLKNVSIAAGSAALFPACSKQSGRWRFFTESEAETLRAICELIIPADEDPGAIDAGVPDFIDRQLAGPYRRHQKTYRKGLVGIDETSQAMFGIRFAALNRNSQTAALKSLESGKAAGPTWQTEPARPFFELVLNHSLQGFYGSPRHGGNRDYVSYRMLKLDYPQIIGQNRYKKT
jgi:gluconate 2-dehydrogenase gamma chain